MAKPKLPKKLYVTSFGQEADWDMNNYPSLKAAKEGAYSGDRIGVYELVKEVTNPKND